MTPLPGGLLVLLVLAMPVAAIAWTVTHEEIFREPRDYCVHRSQSGGVDDGAEVLLHLHVRILLQPLGGAGHDRHDQFRLVYTTGAAISSAASRWSGWRTTT